MDDKDYSCFVLFFISCIKKMDDKDIRNSDENDTLRYINLNEMLRHVVSEWFGK